MRHSLACVIVLIGLAIPARAQDVAVPEVRPDSAYTAMRDSARSLMRRSDAARARGEWKSAFGLLSRGVVLHDSLLDAYNARVIAELRAAHEIEKKDAGIALLQTERARMESASRKQQDSITLSLLALRNAQAVASLQSGETQRMRQQAALLQRERELQGIELARRTAERDMRRAERAEAEQQLLGLREEKQHHASLAARDRLYRNLLIAAAGLLLAASALGIWRIRHRHIADLLRAEAADCQARAVEEQTRAATAIAERNEAASHRIFSQRLIDAQEQERRRISSELHDSLGQDLVVIRNRALMSMRTRENPDEMRANVVKLIEMASSALGDVRQISRDLRPYLIDQIGLSSALRSMVTKVAESSDLHFLVEIDEIDHLLSGENENNLYRLVQESVGNILEHAHAREAVVQLRRDDGELRFEVRDDGCGFDPAAAGSGDGKRLGLGLKSMAERVEMMEGMLDIISAPGRGTCIRAIIPLRVHANEARESTTNAACANEEGLAKQ